MVEVVEHTGTLGRLATGIEAGVALMLTNTIYGDRAERAIKTALGQWVSGLEPMIVYDSDMKPIALSFSADWRGVGSPPHIVPIDIDAEWSTNPRIRAIEELHAYRMAEHVTRLSALDFLEAMSAHLESHA